MMEFCPHCSLSGFSVPLLKIKSSAGSINGICPSESCSFPFSTYSDLQLSLCKQVNDSASEESQTVRGFLDELFGMDHRNEVDAQITSESINFSHAGSESVPTSNASYGFDLTQSDIIEKSPIDDLFQNNYMLPRYLADDMKRIISEDICSQRPQFSTTSVLIFDSEPWVHSSSMVTTFHTLSIIINSHRSSVINNEAVHTLGVPLSSHLRVFEGYICAYDRRNRIPYWVMEHLNPAKLNQEDITKAGVDREKFDFYEDLGEIKMFRSTNDDYFRSGYDRGHLAAAGNHRQSHAAMSQTFILSNITPQVGHGFNRHGWNSLEKYIRAIARKTHNVVVITGPLFLPQEINGKKIVTYEVIGENNVAVPTHFFKVAAIQEKPNGEWRKVAWVMPNIRLPEKVRVDRLLYKEISCLLEYLRGFICLKFVNSQNLDFPKDIVHHHHQAEFQDNYEFLSVTTVANNKDDLEKEYNACLKAEDDLKSNTKEADF
ncbi:unnamed protein product [Heterobilharzia americana]|nr:unnamed protein product [Heterobilharzia americana]